MNKPSFQSAEEVQIFLKETLNYCECASEDALMSLYYVLRIGADIPNSPSKIAKKQLPEGLGEWFIYFLEQKNLIWHGFNNLDFAITESGKNLLAAFEKFSKALGLNMEILNHLADDYYHKGMYSLALQTIERCLTYLPEYPLGHHTQAEILIELGNYEKALEAIQFVISQEGKPSKSEEESPYTYLPIWEEVYLTAAVIYVNLEKYEEAWKAIETSLKLKHTEKAADYKKVILHWLDIEKENQTIQAKNDDE